MSDSDVLHWKGMVLRQNWIKIMCDIYITILTHVENIKWDSCCQIVFSERSETVFSRQQSLSTAWDRPLANHTSTVHGTSYRVSLLRSDFKSEWMMRTALNIYYYSCETAWFATLSVFTYSARIISIRRLRSYVKCVDKIAQCCI